MAKVFEIGISKNFKGKMISVPYVEAITKSGLEQMTRTLSKSYAKYNINIIALRIGVTDTKFHDKNPSKNMRERKNFIPLSRIAHPSEIANVIYLFTTNDFSFCTGTVIDITGGE